MIKVISEKLNLEYIASNFIFMIPKKIGIWLDGSHAFLLEPGQSVQDIKSIESRSIHHLREPGESSNETLFSSSSGKGFHASNNEFKKNKQEQGDLNDYYKRLEAELQQYEEIFLFGPTKAKDELNNILGENKKFKSKVIRVENADKMTPNQLVKIINERFS